MARVPADFEAEFEAKGDRFFAIAELLYANPTRQYTQEELADRFDCSTTTISNHTTAMSEWLNRREEQTTFAWDIEVHDPGSTEGIAAIKHFYADLFALFEKHTNTAPGTFAIIGFALFLSSIVVSSFYVAFSLSITRDSAIPVIIYLVIAIGSFATGMIITLISPFQAWVNGLLWPRLPASVFDRENND